MFTTLFHHDPFPLIQHQTPFNIEQRSPVSYQHETDSILKHTTLHNPLHLITNILSLHLLHDSLFCSTGSDGVRQALRVSSNKGVQKQVDVAHNSGR